MVFKGSRVDWESYFSLYNIEYEILLNIIESLFINGEICSLEDLIKPHVFHKLNPNLVSKLIERGLIKRIRRGNGLKYTVTTRGLIAFFSIVRHIFKSLEEHGNIGDPLSVSERASKKVFLGGIYRVKDAHIGLTNRTLKILEEIGVLSRDNEGKYVVKSLADRVKALSIFLRQMSGLTTIRNPELLIHYACSSLGIPSEYEHQILADLLSGGTIIGGRDSRSSLYDLLIRTRNIAIDKLRKGKLIEAAAYEALGLEILRVIEKMGIADKSYVRENRAKYLFHLYTVIGDYFYNNLLFDLAKIMYHWAVQVAHDNPQLVREAKRVNAKYLLSLARSYAERGRFEEAISRLQELIGYYESTGSMRESLIAKALMNEYMGELEIRKRKPCNAYRSLQKASTMYEEIGGEYRSRGEALRVKSLISMAECYALSSKNYEKAVEILSRASEEADKILSPHLKNVAESILHELRASIHVVNDKYIDASREYFEASKYYSMRGRNTRSLLCLARSHKFRGYHEAINGELEKANKSLEESAKTYYELLKKIIEKYYEKGKLDYYLLKESIKGYYDANALMKLIKYYKLKDRELVRNIKESLLEAGRFLEYKIVDEVLVKNNELETTINNIIKDKEVPPRIKILLHIISSIRGD